MSNESQDDQKASETTAAETPQNETIHQRLKRLSQSTQIGDGFVKGSSLGPITIHPLGSFGPPDDKSST